MKININKDIAVRLAKLVLHAYEDRERVFDMSEYSLKDKEGLKPHQAECSTACCLLGYAPIVFPEYKKLGSWCEVYCALLDKDYDIYVNRHTIDGVHKCLFDQRMPDERAAAVARVWLYISTGEVGSDYDTIRKYKTIKFEDSMIEDLKSVLETKESVMNTLRAFRVRYHPFTDVSPARISIKDMRYGEAVKMESDSEIAYQAEKYLESKGINVVGYAEYGNDIIILSDDFDTDIRTGRERSYE